jgi:hypothetical protein
MQGYLPGPFIYHSSRGDCIQHWIDRLNQLVHPDNDDGALLSGVDQVFQIARSTSQSCQDEISGPIDVAAIDSAGFRWLRRKATLQ